MRSVLTASSCLAAGSLCALLACAPKADAPRPVRTPAPIPGPFDAAAPMIPDGVVIKENNPAFGKTTPAFDEMKNVTVMDNVPADRFMTAMLALKSQIGAECNECHPNEKRYEADEHKAKQQTRDMVRLSMQVNQTFFERQARVTCYTCHRGKWTPPRDPILDDEVRTAKKKAPKLTDAELSRPAEQVFKSVKVFNGQSASKLMKAMDLWTAALGVECTHCHASNYDWAAENIREKDVTRDMVALSKRLNDTWFRGENTATCWHCHRGQALPDRAAPAAGAKK